MNFEELHLDSSVCEGLEVMHFKEMTPIQELAIPPILEGKDVIACAQTGTGKTVAFVLPLLHLLSQDREKESVKAIIVAPTRELAQQIDVQFDGFSYFTPISTMVVGGGGNGSQWEQQKQAMLKGAEVIIATPGRLLAHLQISGIDLKGVKYFILDEADRMLDMGFYEDILQISNAIGKDRQTIMFSATMPPQIRHLAKTILNNDNVAEANVAISKPNEFILQGAYICTEEQKIPIIEDLFKEPYIKKCILFANSKQIVKELCSRLVRLQYNAVEMHSDLEQEERERVMLDFKNGKINILVATDIVSRGIDVNEIGLVINYDVPRDPEDYIHRIGRTARAGAEGTALTLVSQKEQLLFHRIEEFLQKDIYKVPLPEGIGLSPVYAPMKKKKKPFYCRKKSRNNSSPKGRKVVHRHNSKE
ncbi:MAG TPA: ATP-dependent RNA helicase [Porphyromonadaceae bacterium]|nr:ATP-dependent RNA helicase [Porphyromonadaceae bacterium]